MKKCSECEKVQILPKREKLSKIKIKVDDKLELLSDRYPRIKEDIGELTLLIDELLVEYKEYYIQLFDLKE